jgi:hypothetical protein
LQNYFAYPAKAATFEILKQTKKDMSTYRLDAPQKMTVREIRFLLFKTEKYAVIGADEMSNKQSRDFLFALADQDQTKNVIDNTTHLLIWD